MDNNKTTRVIFNTGLAGIDFSYRPNKPYDIEAEQAAKWIACGHCVPAPVEKVETASAKPKVEKAVKARKESE